MCFYQSFGRAKDLVWQHDLFNDSMRAVGLTGIETGTKLYISNLEFGVSNEDIKVRSSISFISNLLIDGILHVFCKFLS